MIDIEAMRADWPIDDDHKATKFPYHCDVCGQRMPCDWSLVVSDLHQALDELVLIRLSVFGLFGTRPTESPGS